MTAGPPAGSGLLDAVAVMDRLRSPGGCPWDAEQTAASLAPYLLEECYEALDAIASGQGEALREELGDVLLQVLFQARVAQEEHGFGIDDVARDLVAKLVRRHPHVFAGRAVDGAAGVARSWEQLKAAEKGRRSALDGIPLGQPALALAGAVQSRVARAPGAPPPAPGGGGFGERLFALVAEARAAGVDAELALRATVLDYCRDVRAAEDARRGPAADPAQRL